MLAIFRAPFANGFSWLKIYEFWLEFHLSLFYVSNQPYCNIGSDNDLVPVRRQVIIWSNVALYASLGRNDLKSRVYKMKGDI